MSGQRDVDAAMADMIAERMIAGMGQKEREAMEEGIAAAMGYRVIERGRSTDGEDVLYVERLDPPDGDGK